MRTRPWWVTTALLVAAGQVVFPFVSGVGDGGLGAGDVLFAAVYFAGAAAIVAGVRSYASMPRRGALLIGPGVIPSIPMILMFWFPPAVAFGLLAGVICGVAFRQAARSAPVRV